ncbi:uncharacterized protein LOC143355540 [Halictus rubicundus]|uniref:uncharacterized protein LOC143355540 n=1 Tax=Halictus rubicundus TaxID=77578 RepID=UPI0040373476
MESSQAGSSFVNIRDSPSEEFTIFDEKGSFMLENDTPTYASSDTLSYVVLQSAVASYIDIDQKSKSIDSNSLIESLSSSEVNEKLSELLQENAKLKETLKQNNIAMKEQFTTLASWQEKMMKVHENHKNKFAETIELVHSLKKENTKLKIKCAMEDFSLKSSHDTCAISETQDRKNYSILDMSLQEIEELSISRQKYEKLPLNFEELNVQENQLSTIKSGQKTETTSTKQPAIEMLGEQAATSKSYVSNYFNQSITQNTPEPVEAVNTCPNCVKCSIKDEEINALKETVVQLEHRQQTETATENKILQNAIKSQESYVEYLESKLKKYKEYKTLFETQLALYEEDFQLERQQKDLLRQENDQIYENLIKSQPNLTED